MQLPPTRHPVVQSFGARCAPYLLLCLCATTRAQGPVPLVNAGFEQPDPKRQGMPLGWGHYPGKPKPPLDFVWDDQQAHSGKRSVCIMLSPQAASWLPSANAAYANTLDKKDIVRTQPRIVVGHEYFLSAYARGEGSGKKRAGMVLRWTNEKGWAPASKTNLFALHGNGWQLLTVAATAPEDAKYICPILQTRGGNEPGRLWFDDVAVVDRTGLTCEVTTQPELCDMSGRWACELTVRSASPDPLPLKVVFTPDAPGTKPVETLGAVSASQPMRSRVEYAATTPHSVRYCVTAPGQTRAIYFAADLAVESALEARLEAPRYRSTFFGAKRDRQVRVHATIHASEALRRQCVLQAQARSEHKALAQRAIEYPAGDAVIELPLTDVPAGTHHVAVRLQAGERVLATVSLPFHCRPELQPAAAIGDRNELLVDGKPVFPIGFYSTLPQDYRRFAKDGFNTVLSYRGKVETCAEMVKQAHTAGLKLIVSAIHANRTAEQIGHAAKTLAPMPGLLGHYLCDEPNSSRAGQSPEDMRTLYERAMAADPGHLTCTVLCVPAEFKLYADTTDVVLVDPYVCFYNTEPDMSRVYQWVDSAREAVRDSKPVWLVPQSFDHLVGPGRYRMPTIEEQRCMCYLGLIHGAKGIIWFTYTGYCVHSEELAKKQGVPYAWVYRGTIPHCFPLRYDGIKQIVREVKELEPIWLSDTPQQPQRVLQGGDAVHTLLKTSGQDTYLFAVNITNAPVRFACELPSCDSAQAMWENRAIAVKAGRLDEQFKPYEVHVYRFRSRR